MKKVILCLVLALLFQVGNLPSSVFASDITIDTTDTDLVASDEYVVTTIMPGDFFTKKLIWNNKSSKTQKLYVCVDDVESNKLNDVLKLKVSTKDTTLLDCKLEDIKANTMFLGEFQSSEQEYITLTIYMEQFADNQYTMLDTEFSVYFLSSEKVKTPDSGDTTELIKWYVLIGICFMSSYFMWRWKQNEENH